MSAPALNQLATAEQPLIEELVGLLWGALGFLMISYAIGRALRAARHGFSIRLQLFFALFSATMMTTTLIGVWALARVEAKAALLFEQRGLSAEVFEEFVRDFGAKTGMILGLLSVICAASAWALGRGLAAPIEQLAQAAADVSVGAEISAIPEPSGREVRHLRRALVLMRDTLEDRRQFEGFIADLSHDLKNPVAAIQASVEVLQSGAGDEPQSRELFLGRIDEASARLNRILSDFLGIARLEARGVRLDPIPFSIDSPIQSAMRALRSLAAARGVSLQSLVQRDHEEIRVVGSARWLSRALENVLSNAIKHSPSGGTVWLDWTLSGARCLILISDEGGGVIPELKSEIFNRFITHAHHHRAIDARGGEGTGLGLAIVARIVEAHRGGVWLIDRGAEPGSTQVTSSARSDELELDTEELTEVLDRSLPRVTRGAQFAIMIPTAYAEVGYPLASLTS